MPPAAPVSIPRLLGAIGSFALLGLVAGLGSGDAPTAARALPAAWMVGGGALLLTGPALVVAHQFLRLEARPDRLVLVLADTFTRAGHVALGLVPAMLLFSATSSLWAVVFALFLAAIGVFGLAHAVRALMAVEEAGDLRRHATMGALTLGWSALVVLIAARLAWDVAGFVLGA